MGRNPNTKCTRCNKEIYRPPGAKKAIGSFCSKICFNKYMGRGEPKPPCPACGKDFSREHKRQIWCSVGCANTARFEGKRRGHIHGNKSKTKLMQLDEAFSHRSCMVEGCNYNKTYDVHRLVPGCEGGAYIIGNMFAICPNHHAEVTRKLIELEKINDFSLRVITK